MIFAFSTSSKVASVAVFDLGGELLFSGEDEANMRASEVCFALLERSGFAPNDGNLFLADIGPGSFTGTRVGVTIAKTLAFLSGGRCGGIDAFDLISPSEVVVFPSKKGEWFVRQPGDAPVRTVDLPPSFIGFGPGIDEPIYPHARNFGALLASIQPMDPTEFNPGYLIEPSISIQKKGLGLSGGVA